MTRDEPFLLQVTVWVDVELVSVPQTELPTFTWTPLSRLAQQSERFQTCTFTTVFDEPKSSFHHGLPLFVVCVHVPEPYDWAALPSTARLGLPDQPSLD